MMRNAKIAVARRAETHPTADHSRKILWIGLASLAMFLAALATSLPAAARGAPESFADLAEELLPTVVNISTSQTIEGRDDEGRGSEELEELFREFFERRGQEPPQQRRRANSLGSGFIIDATGYIVTNHHVIADADEIRVRLSDNTVLDATLVGSDKDTDLAVLKVESETPLPAAKWGDSSKTRIGDWVVAIGNPFGLGGTVTAGIVSARQRDINQGRYDDFIQTDAAINRGNSGGPMFNLDGDVIGVNTAIFSPSGGSVGIGFAIPSTLASNIVAQLRSGGEVRRGWLGVRIQTVTEELAEGLRLGQPRGALVSQVTEGGPAEAAGILQGDVILTFNGRPVEEMRKLPRMVAETSIGSDVTVTVWRRGEEKTFDVHLGELDADVVAAALQPDSGNEDLGDEGRVSELGLGLGTITDELRQRFDLSEETKGVAITAVDPESSASERGLQPGDVIVEVDQEPVLTPGDVAQQVEAAKSEGYDVVTLWVVRRGDFRWVAVRLKEG